MLTVILSYVISNWRVILFGGAALAIVAWALNERESLINQGVQQERAAMEAANAKAKSDADKAQAEVDACYARGAGYTWDRVNGLCNGPAASKPPVRRPHG